MPKWYRTRIQSKIEEKKLKNKLQYTQKTQDQQSNLKRSEKKKLKKLKNE